MNCFAKVYKRVSFVFENNLLRQNHSYESRINIFTIVRRGGRGQRVMIGIVIKVKVHNYGRPLSTNLLWSEAARDTMLIDRTATVL